MRSMTLLRSRRFLPLFLTQALGALNDNLFKNALVVLVLFDLLQSGGAQSGGTVLVELSGGVFILPYALLSATAGRLADRMEKSRLIRLTKLAELGLMLLAALGFLSGSVALMMVVLFGLGVQATFFGPVKYGILPNLLPEADLMAGNGLVEAGTFLGILAGTIAGGALILLPGGVEIVSAAGLIVALAGLTSAWFIPIVPPAAPGLRLGWNIWGQTVALLQESRQLPTVWMCTLGISWFWVVGATILAAFPPLARDTLGADGHVVTLMLAAFSVGIGLGSVLCARLLRGEVSARLVPYAAFGLSVFIADFAHVAVTAGRLADVHAVLNSFAGVRMVVDLTLLAVSGGIYSVPLYALIQERSDAARRSRMIASNNVVNAAAMVVAAAMTAGLSASGMSPPGILMVLAGANLLVVVWMLRRTVVSFQSSGSRYKRGLGDSRLNPDD